MFINYTYTLYYTNKMMWIWIWISNLCFLGHSEGAKSKARNWWDHCTSTCQFDQNVGRGQRGHLLDHFLVGTGTVAAEREKLEPTLLCHASDKIENEEHGTENSDLANSDKLGRKKNEKTKKHFGLKKNSFKNCVRKGGDFWNSCIFESLNEFWMNHENKTDITRHDSLHKHYITWPWP